VPRRDASRLGDLLLGDALGERGVVTGEQQVVVPERGRVDSEVGPHAERVAVARVDSQNGELWVDRRGARRCLVLRDVGIAAERLEVAVRRGVGDRDRPHARARRLQALVGPQDRLGDALRGQVEDARVEQVAAQERVAGRVGRPDRPGGRMRVRGRQQEALAVDARRRHALQDLLGHRVGQAAQVRLHERELAAGGLQDDRSRAHACVDAAAGHERLGVQVLVGIGDDLHRQLRGVLRVGQSRPRRVGEQRRPHGRGDVRARGAGSQRRGCVRPARRGVRLQPPRGGAFPVDRHPHVRAAAFLHGGTAAIGQAQADNARLPGAAEGHRALPDDGAAPMGHHLRAPRPVRDHLHAQHPRAQHGALALVDHARLRRDRGIGGYDREDGRHQRGPAQDSSHALEYERPARSARHPLPSQARRLVGVQPLFRARPSAAARTDTFRALQG
jgi:hypothetical protein